MYAPNLPNAWEIHEIERMRRVRESEAGQDARIPLYPPPPPPPAERRREREEPEGKRVVVIQIW